MNKPLHHFPKIPHFLPSSIGELSQRISRDLLKTSKTPLVPLILHWHSIVGEFWGTRCTPIALKTPSKFTSIKHATLTLKARPGAALELQHALPLLENQVNLFYGYPLVGKIMIKQ